MIVQTISIYQLSNDIEACSGAKRLFVAEASWARILTVFELAPAGSSDAETLHTCVNCVMNAFTGRITRRPHRLVDVNHSYTHINPL